MTAPVRDLIFARDLVDVYHEPSEDVRSIVVAAFDYSAELNRAPWVQLEDYAMSWEAALKLAEALKMAAMLAAGRHREVHR